MTHHSSIVHSRPTSRHPSPYEGNTPRIGRAPHRAHHRDHVDHVPMQATPPTQGPTGNSHSQRERPATVRTRGAMPSVGLRGWVREVSQLRDPRPSMGRTRRQRACEGAYPCVCTHGRGAIWASEGSGTTRPPMGWRGCGKTETRNAGAAGAGYVPLSVSDLRGCLKGGPRNPPQILALREGGCHG